MNVRLQPIAVDQLRALPAPAARKVLAALRVLAVVPHSGRRLRDDSAVGGLMQKIVRIRRGWSYRIVYEIHVAQIDVLLIVST